MSHRMLVYTGVVLLSFMISGCEENYQEEQFNVIVPALPDNPELAAEEEQNVQSLDEDQPQELAKNNEKVEEEPAKTPRPKNTVKASPSAQESAPSVQEKTVENTLESTTENTEPVGLPPLSEAAEIQKKAEKELKDESSAKPSQQNPVEQKNDFEKKQTNPIEKKVLKTPKTAESKDPREAARNKWKELKNFASRRGFSEEDIQTLIPESLSIDNYIKFGEIDTTEAKLNVIEEKLKSVRISRGYVKQKLSTVLDKVAKANLSLDEKNDLNIRLKQIEQSIANNDYDRSNRELNEINVDLGQMQNLDKAFEN